MSAKNLIIKMNLVGFNSDLTDKFTKQIDAINRMNTAQNHLQYQWEIGQNAYQCQVHFVIEPTLPYYLKQSKAPILTNQKLEAENVIACSHPITTFDLIDVLKNIEQMFFINATPEKSNDLSDKPDIVFWRDGVMVKANHLEDKQNISALSKPITDDTKTNTTQTAEEKPVFYTYGSFRKSASKDNQQSAFSVSNNILPPSSDSSSAADATTETKSDTANLPKEKFILYGSLKNKSIFQNKVDNTSTQIVTAQTGESKPILKESTTNNNDVDSNTSKIETIAKTITASAEASTNNTLTKPTHQDVWENLAKHTSGIVGIASLNVYVNYDQKIITAPVTNLSELVGILLQNNSEPAQTTNAVPETLKAFPLSAALWSYGLHTPKCDEQSKDLDLENNEWKLKGFPKFGQWETHPTWLFLATLFAQSYHSIYAAQLKGKASHEQIKHFIYAAHLAGLTWQTQALSEDKKQQQQDALQLIKPEQSSWITRLREKLHTNEHFKSSLD